MMLRYSLNRAVRRKGSYFPIEQLVDDLLCPIIEQVDEIQDLLSLCLVSKRFYLRAISVLYRDVRLKLLRASHRQLLQRLTHPQSNLPERILVLRIMDTNFMTEDQKADVCILLRKSKNLRVFKWIGTSDMPHTILDILESQFPMARFEIKDSSGRSNSPDDDMNQPGPRQPYEFLTHSAHSQLTRLQFEPCSEAQYYPTFKLDFIKMLRNTPKLSHLELHCLYAPDYPEYIQHFRDVELPKLTFFSLQSWGNSLFTLRELMSWQLQGGWQNLIALRLRDMELLLAFLGQTPNLEILCLLAVIYEDMGHIEEALTDADTSGLFPKLRKFTYRNDELNRPPGHDLFPLRLLQFMPHITNLDLFQDHFSTSEAYPKVDTLTAQNIQDIRKWCPNIEDLGIDVQLLGPYAKWPNDILNELASFEKPITLTFYLHRLDTKRAKLSKGRVDYFIVSRRMRKKRQRLDLPWLEPFEIQFKLVQPYRADWRPCEMLDYWATNSNSRLGASTTLWFGYGRGYKDMLGLGYLVRWLEKEEDLDEMDLASLRESMASSRIGNLGWDRKGYKKEIRRRKRDEAANRVEYPTLYDAWIRNDVTEESKA